MWKRLAHLQLTLLTCLFLLSLQIPLSAEVSLCGNAGRLDGTFHSSEPACDQIYNQWIPVGPGFVEIEDFHFDSSNSDTVYAFGQESGLYKSDDGGLSWRRLRLNDEIEVYGVQGSGDHLFVAGGFRGLLESRDGGLTWLPNGDFDVVDGIWQSSVDSREFWLHVHNSGLYLSKDSGDSWMSVASPSNVTDLLHVGQTVYLTAFSGTYRSSDSGESWEEWVIPDPDEPYSGRKLKLSHLYFVSGAIYSIMPTDFPSTGSGVYRSTDGGENWETLLGGRDSEFIGSRGISGLAVDPLDNKHLIVSTFSGLYESSDSGQTWTQPTVLSGRYVSTVQFDPRVLNRAFIGLSQYDAGIFGSADRGQTWQASTDGIQGQVYSFSVGPDGTILVGNQTGIYKGSLSGSNGSMDWPWTTTTADHYSATTLVYQSLKTPGIALAENADREFLYSSNGGQTWHDDVSGLPSTATLSIVEDPSGSGKIYLTNAEGVYLTEDGGQNWEKLSSGPPIDGSVTTVRSLAINPTNSLEMFAATSKGIFRSTDGGKTWSSDGIEIPQYPWGIAATNISKIYTHPQDGQVLYAAAGSTLFLSSDRGESWSIIFDESPIDELVFSPQKADDIWLRANNIFRSTNGGATWTEYPAEGQGGPTSHYESLGILLEDSTGVLAGSKHEGLWFLQPGPENLYFPIYDDPVGAFVGFAASNYGGASKTLDFEARDQQGALLRLSSNPTSEQLTGHHQLARQGHELVGKSDGLGEEAWMKIQSDGPGLGSFFQTGSNQLKWLDGAIAQTEVEKLLYFTRVYSGDTAFRGFAAETIFHLANPGNSEAFLEIRLLGGSGARSGFRQAPVSRTISAGGVLRVSARELFGNDFEGTGKVVEVKVTDGCGVVGLQEVRLPDAETLFMLNAQTFNEQNRLYSSQLASLPDVMYTSLKLFNASQWQRNIEVLPVDDEGNELSDAREIVLKPGESIEEDCRIFFGFSGSAVGSLIIRGEGYGIIGDVVFGDPLAQKFAAALPLQRKPFFRAVFSQVANVGSFFTGLALMNVPYGENVWSAHISIDVYDSEGNKTGRGWEVLEPGARRSQLLKEFVPSTAEQIGGYFVIKSDEPIIAQQLFGTNDLSVLAAVPPKIIQAVNLLSDFNPGLLENKARE